MVDDRKQPSPIRLATERDFGVALCKTLGIDSMWFTERELVDLSRLAASEDRKLSELVRFIVRRHLYGNIGCPGEDFHGASSADQAREQ